MGGPRGPGCVQLEGASEPDLDQRFNPLASCHSQAGSQAWLSPWPLLTQALASLTSLPEEASASWKLQRGSGLCFVLPLHPA